jgi:maltooligosyltrehalose trehalohydrolase
MDPSLATSLKRRMPVGAEVLPDGAGVSFRVWAPKCQKVSVVLERADRSVGTETAMQREPDGYHAAYVAEAGAGSLYRFRVGASGDGFPDPASRFQPRGPHGPSEVVDADRFPWTDRDWRGLSLRGQVLYELHVGTFTEQGTWQAAARELPRLADLGITGVEIMPVAEFPGTFGWGYDGVDLFAPSHLYGTPDDFRAFVDRAHAIGIGVLLDVVYNHVGPDGNYLWQYADAYFSKRYSSEWGDAINYDDEAGPVREFVLANAAYWIREFHLDGLRLDATQQIFDASSPHILQEIAAHAREAAGRRAILLVAENEPQHTRLVRRVEDGGYGLDALWNDDFHHSAFVALTGRREAYYTDYCGSAQEMISLARWGFLFQGQRYDWQRARRGSPSFGLRPSQFITFLENHDQVANAPSGHGERLHQITGPAAYRAMTGYWLLSPGTPMFFQGQEFGASTPFRYFADHKTPLADSVRKGRAEFMQQFFSAAHTDLLERLPDPSDEQSFLACRLRHVEPEQHARTSALHRDLLALRRTDALLAGEHIFIEGAVLSPSAFVLRFFSGDPRTFISDGRDRLLVVNLGADLHLETAPEPLLAPPPDCEWSILWSSEDPAYGGLGIAPLETDRNWLVPGFSATFLVPRAL